LGENVGETTVPTQQEIIVAQPVQQQPKWPLWMLGAVLLSLLTLAGVYWANPELLSPH